MFGLHFLRLRFLARSDRRDLALLLLLRLRELLVEFQDGLVRLDILFRDRLLPLAVDLVGEDFLLRGQLGDFLMPSESRMLSGFSKLSGVCSR